MRIATANLRHGGPTSPVNVWQCLINEAKVDVLCAQESRAPLDYFAGSSPAGSSVFNTAPSRSWGSAVWSRRYPLEEFDLDAFRGHVTAARATDVRLGGEPWTVDFVSVHIPGPAPYERHVDRLIDMFAARPRSSLLVLAGDFNITTALRHPTESLKTSKAEQAILTRLRSELGVVNAWQVLHPNQPLPQTLRWTASPDTPYHCDAIYIDCRALPYLKQAEVLPNSDWSHLTDHNPILVDFREV